MCWQHWRGTDSLSRPVWPMRVQMVRTAWRAMRARDACIGRQCGARAWAHALASWKVLHLHCVAEHTTAERRAALLPQGPGRAVRRHVPLERSPHVRQMQRLLQVRARLQRVTPDRPELARRTTTEVGIQPLMSML